LSPIVIVPKKNGKLIFYIDFRKLNVASNVQIVAPHKQKTQYKTTDLFLKRL